ncbi:MAG TPA: FAD binding domain-containing protein [Solirubrobacteraceae bacterium]|nr:FAD binding domain-containing protein [Solirubrobacteraceae bacterium]
MYSAPFEYLRASSWEEAVAQLERGDEDAHVLAGGQSLVPMMMLGLAAPTLLVDVGGAGERTIERRNGSLVLSALARHVDVEHSDVVRDACPMLTEAVKHIGNVRVRHRGTIGGSLAHAEATAELATVAVAQRATVHVLGPRGARTVPAAELFVTHLTSSLEPAEVINAVEFPLAGGPRRGSSFLEMARRAGDFAMVEVAATVSLDDAGRCDDVRLVVGAVADRPADVSDAAQALIGGPPGQPAVAELARAVAEQVEIGPSSHASVEYRREMVAVLVARAVQTATTRAES